MQTYSWNPWSIFDELERTIRRLEPAGAMIAGPAGWPTFDIEDTDDQTVLTADLPGLTEDDVEITVAGSILTVRGERKDRRRSTAFERRFWLAEGHDLERVNAHLANGVLTIALATTAKAKPRRIKLGTGVVQRVKGLLVGDKDKQHAA